MGGGAAVEDLGARRAGGLLRAEREARDAEEGGNAARLVPLPERRGRPFLVGGAAPIRAGAGGAGSALVEDLGVRASGGASQETDALLATAGEVGHCAHTCGHL